MTVELLFIAQGLYDVKACAMAEKPSAQVCGNGAIDAHKKKAAAHFLIKSLEKKISGEHLLLATAQAPPLPSL